jgi:hypothetical protein
MMTSRRILLQAFALGAAMTPRASFAAATSPSKDVMLYIITPHDGQTVHGAFWCRFGLRNMGVSPAGQAVPRTGHHHLLIDVTDPLDPNLPIPADSQHVHFGGGQTETHLELSRGPHTLQLVLGDADHMLFDPPVVSRKIRIFVQ